MFQRPIKMVIVDDEPEIADILSENVHDLFPEVFDITFQGNPVEALKFIENNSVLVVITDVNMPQINGDHLNLKIKNLHRGIQTIILTGGHNYTTAVTCFRDGANGYIAKPFNMNEIEETVGGVLNSLLSWEKVFKKVMNAKKAS